MVTAGCVDTTVSTGMYYVFWLSIPTALEPDYYESLCYLLSSGPLLSSPMCTELVLPSAGQRPPISIKPHSDITSANVVASDPKASPSPYRKTWPLTALSATGTRSPHTCWRHSTCVMRRPWPSTAYVTSSSQSEQGDGGGARKHAVYWLNEKGKHCSWDLTVLSAETQLDQVQLSGLVFGYTPYRH